MGIFLSQGSHLCLLHWQVDSLPLSHPGSPTHFLKCSSRFLAQRTPIYPAKAQLRRFVSHEAFLGCPFCPDRRNCLFVFAFVALGACSKAHLWFTQGWMFLTSSTTPHVTIRQPGLLLSTPTATPQPLLLDSHSLHLLPPSHTA